MTGSFGIFVFLFTLVVSLLITRLATVILTFTGLSWEVARFQARSAFTGTGFTTAEAESVVNHPVRRRIVMLLMLVRSAGFITLITSLMFSFMDGAAEQTRIVRFILLVSGVLMIWAISQSKPVERILNHLIEAALRRWTDLDTRDYASLLNLSGGFSVMELLVRHNDWLAGSRLQDLQLPREGIVVLGINRQDGKYDGVPSGNTVIKAGDRLIAYGQAAALRELDQRTGGEKGEAAHIAAVEQYEQSLHHKTDRMM